MVASRSSEDDGAFRPANYALNLHAARVKGCCGFPGWPETYPAFYFLSITPVRDGKIVVDGDMWSKELTINEKRGCLGSSAKPRSLACTLWEPKETTFRAPQSQGMDRVLRRDSVHLLEKPACVARILAGVTRIPLSSHRARFARRTSDDRISARNKQTQRHATDSTDGENAPRTNPVRGKY